MRCQIIFEGHHGKTTMRERGASVPRRHHDGLSVNIEGRVQNPARSGELRELFEEVVIIGGAVARN